MSIFEQDGNLPTPDAQEQGLPNAVDIDAFLQENSDFWDNFPVPERDSEYPYTVLDQIHSVLAGALAPEVDLDHTTEGIGSIEAGSLGPIPPSVMADPSTTLSYIRRFLDEHVALKMDFDLKYAAFPVATATPELAPTPTTVERPHSDLLEEIGPFFESIFKAKKLLDGLDETKLFEATAEERPQVLAIRRQLQYFFNSNSIYLYRLRMIRAFNKGSVLRHAPRSDSERPRGSHLGGGPRYTWAEAERFVQGLNVLEGGTASEAKKDSDK